MEYFSVKNHKKFQHYKNRTPPWIKLHRTIFTDYEFSCLQDASKLHLILIWLLASEMDNKIPYDPDWVQKRLGLQKPVNLKALKEKGFIAVDSVMLAECLQGARAEGEGEGEGYKQETENPLSEKEEFALVWENRFEQAWIAYPEKKGKDKARRHFKAQVLTFLDLDDLLRAMGNYEAETARVRANGHADRAWMHGGTWFNKNWRDFIAYEPPPEVDQKSPLQKDLEKFKAVGEEWINETEEPRKGLIS